MLLLGGGCKGAGSRATKVPGPTGAPLPQRKTHGARPTRVPVGRVGPSHGTLLPVAANRLRWEGTREPKGGTSAPGNRRAPPTREARHATAGRVAGEGRLTASALQGGAGASALQGGAGWADKMAPLATAATRRQQGRDTQCLPCADEAWGTATQRGGESSPVAPPPPPSHAAYRWPGWCGSEMTMVVSQPPVEGTFGGPPKSARPRWTNCPHAGNADDPRNQPTPRSRARCRQPVPAHSADSCATARYSVEGWPVGATMPAREKQWPRPAHPLQKRVCRDRTRRRRVHPTALAATKANNAVFSECW